MDEIASFFKAGFPKDPVDFEKQMAKEFRPSSGIVPSLSPPPSRPRRSVGLNFTYPDPPPSPSPSYRNVSPLQSPYEKYDLGFSKMPQMSPPKLDIETEQAPEELSPDLQKMVDETPKAEDPIQVVKARARKAKQDPAFRQKLIGDINNPGSEFKPQQMINPITETSKWWKRYTQNLAEPFEQAAADTRWFGPILKGLAWVSAPFNAVTSIATTTLGYEKAPSFTDAAFQNIEDIYRRGDEWADLGAISTLAGGMLLDFANPLNFLTLGAKPVYTAARALSRTAPAAAGVADLAKLSEVGNLRYRQVAKLTPETIKDFAAPKMVLENAKGVFSEAMQKEAASLGAPVEAVSAKNAEFANVLALLEGPYKYNKAVDGTTKTFSEMVAEARNLPDLYNYQKIPSLIADPKTNLATVADALAKHTAYMEKAIWDARPLLRIAGKTLGWGEWRVPSPVEVFRDMGSKAAGKWVEYQMPRLPVAQSLGTAADGFREYFTRRLNIDPRAWGNFTGKDMENALQAFQTAVPQYVKGVRGPGGFRQVPGLLFGEKALEDWVFAEIDPRGMLNLKNKERHIGHIVDSYKAMRELISREPNALWTRTVDEMDQAIDILEGIQKEGADDFIDRMNKAKRPRSQGNRLLKDPRGNRVPKGTPSPDIKIPYKAARTPEQVFEEFKANLGNFRRLVYDTEDVAKNLKGGAARTAGEYTDAMAAALSASKSDFAKYAGKTDEIWVVVDKIRADWETLMNSTRPYAFDLIDVYQKRNLGHMIDRIRNDANAVKLWVDKYFVNSEKSVSGVEALGRMLNTSGGRDFWAKWAAPVKGPYADAWDLRSTLYRTDPVTGARVPGYALTQDQRMAVQGALGKKLNNLEASGKMTSAEVQEVANFVGALSDEQVGKLIYTMNNASASRLTSNLRARVVHQLSAPFEAALEKAEALLRTTYASDLRQIYNTYASIQTHFEPHWIMNALYKPGGVMDLTDKLYGKVMRGIGFSPLAESTLRNLETERVHNKYRSEAFGREWSQKNIVENALKVDSRLGAQMSKALESELNEAYGQIVSNQLSLDYANKVADKVMGKVQGFKGTFSEFVRQHAKQEFDEGWARLAKVFEGDNAKAKQFFDSVNHNKFLDRLFKEESRLGMQNLPRESYLNYFLTGNTEHIRELQQGIDKALDAMYGATQMSPSVASPFFGPGQKRRFLDVAEVISKAKWENMARQGTKKQLLDVAPLYNVSALLGERYSNHLNGVLARRSLSDLQAVLPEYVKVFTKKPKENWKDIGELVGSFKGKGWYVEQKLYDHIKMYVPVYEREKNLFNHIIQANQWITRLATNFTLNHIKNQAALAFVGQVKPALFQKWVKYMWDNRDKTTKYSRLNPLAPFERMKYAIDNHPLYKEMVSNGVTHFRGDFDFNSTAQNIVEAMTPVKSFGGRVAHSLGFRKKDILPSAMPDDVFTTMVFDVIDRGLKIAKYDELRAAGIPGREAANMVNHFLIDYSARMLNPEVKRMGYAFMPFFSWNVANATLHIPNMLMNPRMYAIARTANQWVNQRYSPWANHRYEDVPSPVAYAVATPWTSSQGFTNWVFPEYPWDAWERLAVNLGKNPTNVRYMMSELSRFLLARTRWADFIMTGMNYTMRKKSEQKSALEEYLGSVKEQGQLEEMAWGLLPYYQLLQIGAQSMVDPNAWKDLPMAAANMIVHVEPVDVRGRVAYSGEYKRNLGKAIGIEE